MKKVVNAAIAVLVVLFLAWCGGFDFNERGGTAFFIALISLYFGFFVYILTEDDKERSRG